ncbi:MAG: PPOX class F420-dependent oxidoreductase [Actinomycetes bacterium]
MGPSDAVSWVRTNHRAVVAVLRPDGRPGLTPVTVGAEDDVIVISTREPSMKVRHLRRDPRIWMCLINDGFFGDFLVVEGDVEIVPLPDAMEGLVDYYRNISGEHSDWEDYRAAMVRDQRCLLRITPTYVGPTVGG